MSFLGGQKIEGIVVKNYQRLTQFGSVMLGKYVSERFKEIHGGEWRKNNPTPGDVVDRIIMDFRTPARWHKAVQHLQERGELEGSPRDIGKLVKEVPDDIFAEAEGEIKDTLFNYFKSKIRRGVVAGLPEWYKQELLERAFTE
jgi:hypothetical protein